MVSDIFGFKNAGAIMGRMLTAFSIAAVAGPGMLASLRSIGNEHAIRTLTERVDADVFSLAFGASKENLTELIQAKTVTIDGLVALLPCPEVPVDMQPLTQAKELALKIGEFHPAVLM